MMAIRCDGAILCLAVIRLAPGETGRCTRRGIGQSQDALGANRDSPRPSARCFMEAPVIPAYATHYDFDWDDLGDIDCGRPNLGQQMPVAVYRLAQYTMREALKQRFGAETAGDLLREAGWIAGREFCLNTLNRDQALTAFLAELQARLKELAIGVLRIENADLDRLELTVTVSEDLDCSGLAVTGETICDYDEGFIAGILHAYSGQDFSVTEVDCWATGDRTCRFAIKPATAAA